MNDRGQTESIGTILLIGIAITGAVIAGLYGSNAMGTIEGSMQDRNVEQSMKQLDAEASQVALGDSPSQSVTVPTYQGSKMGTEDSGWIRVQIFNATDDSLESVPVNESLGKITYEQDGTEYAYQGGGVFREEDNASFVVSSPEVYYRDNTLTLPIIKVGGDQRLNGDVELKKEGDTERVYPNASKGNQNPITDRKRVNITIRSEYYDAWGRFLKQRTGGLVDVNPANKTVTLVLVTFPAGEEGSIDAAVVSSAGPGSEMTLDNGAKVLSYNSSNADPLSSIGDEGKIKMAGDLKLQSNTLVRGDVLAAGDVELTGSNSTLDGDLLCTEGNFPCLEDDSGDLTGTEQNTNKNISDPEPVDVDAIIQDINNDNDNDQDSDINNNELVDNNNRMLPPGNYSLDNFDEDQNVILNITNGSISLAVSGKFDLDDADICIVYDGKEDGNVVEMYLADQGTGSSNSEIQLDNDADVATYHKSNSDDCHSDDDLEGDYVSHKFKVYSPPGVDADLGQQVDFTGVIYAPDSPTEAGTVSLAGGRIYGAVVGHVTDMDENNRKSIIYYDTNLGDGDLLAPDTDTVRVSYLHVTVNQLNATS